MFTDMDDEFTKNVSATSRGQAVSGAASLGSRSKNGGAAIEWGDGNIKTPYAELVAGAICDVGTSLTIDIIGTTDAALTASLVVLSTITLTTAQLNTTAGQIFAMPPLLPGNPRQYLGCRFTPAGGNATTGQFVVGLVPKDTRLQSYKGSGPI